MSEASIRDLDWAREPCGRPLAGCAENHRCLAAFLEATAHEDIRLPTPTEVEVLRLRAALEFAEPGREGCLIVAAVALLALLPVVLASAAAPVLPGPSTAAAWTRHPADYVALPTVIACLLGLLLINR